MNTVIESIWNKTHNDTRNYLRRCWCDVANKFKINLHSVNTSRPVELGIILLLLPSLLLSYVVHWVSEWASCELWCRNENRNKTCACCQRNTETFNVQFNAVVYTSSMYVFYMMVYVQNPHKNVYRTELNGLNVDTHVWCYSKPIFVVSAGVEWSTVYHDCFVCVWLCVNLIVFILWIICYAALHVLCYSDKFQFNFETSFANTAFHYIENARVCL